MNNDTTTEITRRSANTWFYERITALKPRLPKDHKMPLLEYLPKAYDSYGGGLIIQAVLNCRTTDMNVLEALEKLVNDGK